MDITHYYIHKPTSIAESVKNQTPFSPIIFLLTNPRNDVVRETRDSPIQNIPKREAKQLFNINDERDGVKPTRIVPLNVSP